MAKKKGTFVITHIVMIKFESNGNNEEIKEIKSMLEKLPESIQQINHIEVGINYSTEERAMDMVLCSRFESKEDLDIYANHPAHLEVLGKISKIAQYSKVVDYET